LSRKTKEEAHFVGKFQVSFAPGTAKVESRAAEGNWPILIGNEVANGLAPE